MLIWKFIVLKLDNEMKISCPVQRRTLSSLLLRIMRSCILTTAIMLKSMAPLMIVQP
ncbi:hypothetical protein NC651_011462 [Populus alba x Populus x berolinensis]|nr:hypothetical protein NC651_011462 [Populus alba x Populus x berolinensis]